MFELPLRAQHQPLDRLLSEYDVLLSLNPQRPVEFAILRVSSWVSSWKESALTARMIRFRWRG